jgi:Uma2 family endonuclease
MTVLKRDAERHTYADYLIWSRTYGDELIDGTAYVRQPPAPTWSHQMIVTEVSRQIANALEGKPCRVCVAPSDIRLSKFSQEDDQIDTVVQPDIFIVCDLRKIDTRGLCGAPDWLAEVLSPGTARYDQLTKLPAYERAGVREVWLIDPTDRTVSIWRLDAGRYGPPSILELKGRTELTAVDGVTIDWDRVVAKMV